MSYKLRVRERKEAWPCVALVEKRLIARELGDGTLIAPFGTVEFDGGLRVLPAAGQRLNAQAEAFVAWLRDSLARK